MDRKLSEIIGFIEKEVPLESQSSWDNSGLQLGNQHQRVEKVLVALDATTEVIEEAIQLQVDLLITHHPLIFKGLKAIDAEDFIGNRVRKLIQHDIALYSMHTNWDSHESGHADAIAQALELNEVKPLAYEGVHGQFGVGAIGVLTHALELKLFLELLTQKTGHPIIAYVMGHSRQIKTVAICPGSGMDLVQYAFKAKADLFITGDIKYHDALDAKEKGLNLCDLGHYPTEIGYTHKIVQMLNEEFSDLSIAITSQNGNPFQ